ncbi:MAG: ppox class probable f420-dependent enzyme family [Microvirga sp.]|jgi:PPOX class probable F420-dependent enzyme|nr:ppox class probable f420-dependent enzyme family [Microvirga sp.]
MQGAGLCLRQKRYLRGRQFKFTSDPAEEARAKLDVPEMLSDFERRFLADRRVGHLATADCERVPHVLPVCFAVSESTVYVTIDEKPKANRAPLKRVRNIIENGAAAFVADRYDEDWSLLGWIMLRGRARILSSGAEHDAAQALLRHRYAQLEPMQIATLPVIAVQIERVTSWGNLSIAPRV